MAGTSPATVALALDVKARVDWVKKMFKRLVVGCLAFWLFGANAGPVVYTSTQYNTVAVASAGGGADFNTASSPTAAQPVVTSATAFDATDFASALGIAATGLLTTQAEASSLAGVASAVGTSEFIGAFDLGTALQLSIDMTNVVFADAVAFSGGTLFLLLTVDGITYLDEQLTSAGMYDYTVGPSNGGSYTLSLLLSSEASTSAGGNASNFASVTFNASAVPEPSTLLLCAIGLIGCTWLQRRKTLA